MLPNLLLRQQPKAKSRRKTPKGKTRRYPLEGHKLMEADSAEATDPVTQRASKGFQLEPLRVIMTI